MSDPSNVGPTPPKQLTESSPVSSQKGAPAAVPFKIGNLTYFGGDAQKLWNILSQNVIREIQRETAKWKELLEKQKETYRNG